MSSMVMLICFSMFMMNANSNSNFMFMMNVDLASPYPWFFMTVLVIAGLVYKISSNHGAQNGIIILTILVIAGLTYNQQAQNGFQNLISLSNQGLLPSSESKSHDYFVEPKTTAPPKPEVVPIVNQLVLSCLVRFLTHFLANLILVISLDLLFIFAVVVSIWVHLVLLVLKQLQVDGLVAFDLVFIPVAHIIIILIVE